MKTTSRGLTLQINKSSIKVSDKEHSEIFNFADSKESKKEALEDAKAVINLAYFK